LETSQSNTALIKTVSGATYKPWKCDWCFMFDKNQKCIYTRFLMSNCGELLFSSEAKVVGEDLDIFSVGAVSLYHIL
jgi:hypothetical protein